MRRLTKVYFWVLLYLLFMNGIRFIFGTQTSGRILPVLLMVYWAVLFFASARPFACCADRTHSDFCGSRCGTPAEFYGLCLPKDGKALPWLLPGLLLPAINLYRMYASGALRPENPIGISAVFPGGLCFLVSGVLAEELLFRGVLLREIFEIQRRSARKNGILFPLLTSSAIFALFHLINIASGADLFYTAAQAVCAFLMGIYLGALFMRSGSLFPGIAVHLLVNLTAAYAAEVSIAAAGALAGAAVSGTAVYCAAAGAPAGTLVYIAAAAVCAAAGFFMVKKEIYEAVH